MHKCTAPCDKILCVIRCCDIIENALRLNSGDAIGADSFLPVLIYIVLKSNPPCFYASIRYISVYHDPSKLLQRAGYCLTSLDVAARFIENINTSQLSNMSSAQFLAESPNNVRKSVQITDIVNIPADSSTSVMLFGDTEICTPKILLQQLQYYDREVGFQEDTLYSKGGSVAILEKEIAIRLGKEAAIFVPSCSLANHIAIRFHCQKTQRYRCIVQEQSHVYNDSGDSLSKISGIQLIPLGYDKILFTLDELNQTIKRSEEGILPNPVGCVSIETPVKRKYNQAPKIELLENICEICRIRGLPTHFDGARLFMLSTFTGISPNR